jgi:hypothetical protein
MVKIQTRGQLVQWLSYNLRFIGRRSLARALDEGIVRVLGGFSPIPPGTLPGWIISVTSVHGKRWHVAVLAHGNSYGVRLLDRIPWANWTGGKTELYIGDDPKRYERMKHAVPKVASDR